MQAAGGVHAEERRAVLVAVTGVQLVVVVWLSARGWGGWGSLISHPARAAFVALMVVATLVGLASPVNLSSGEREDPASRRLFFPAAAGVLFLAWLMPLMDR